MSMFRRSFFMIRHKPTGNYMPTRPKGRGYTAWKPEEPASTPRLFTKKHFAQASIDHWLAGITTVTVSYDNWSGDYDEDWRLTKVEGRRAEDLEIVEIKLVEIVE